MGTDADLWTPGGETGPAGPAGPQGPAGPPIELRTNDTHVQWRVEGDVTWIDLEPLANLIGPIGPTGPKGARGDTGETGDNIELQTSATHIQWRVVGDVAWINLVSLADLEGDPGQASTILRDTGEPDDALDGEDGDYYIQEDEPDFGVVLFGPKSGGTWPGNFIPLSGGDGSTWFNGTGAPAAGLGITLDYYLDTANGDVYEKQAPTTWTLIANIEGPQGPQGDQGPAGSNTLEALTDTDVPAPTNGQVLTWDGSFWTAVNPVTGVTSFTQMDDTPANYSGAANFAVRVNGLEDALEFVDLDTLYLSQTNNLSDLADASTARTNLGLGTASTEADTKYAHRANDLSDLASVATARTNLNVPSLAGGANANFTAMPQVGGDPIVESGSNSDGEWTRWADGTQIVVMKLTSGSSGMVNKTYPAAFLSGLSSGEIAFGCVISSASLTTLTAKVDAVTSTAFNFGIVTGSGSWVAGDNNGTTATGRWK